MVLTAFSQKPVPNFGANIKSGCAPLIVQFSDSSLNSPTSWNWDLGNGTFSTQQNPIATYFNPGSYSVKLIATNASGVDSVRKVNFIIVNDVPTVSFSSNTTAGCYPLKVQFTDFSSPNSGTISSWLWDFGDGNTSTQQNPTNTYTSVGSFTVTLKVKNSAGCEKILNKPNLINIAGGVKADFSIGSLNSCSAPVNVSFVNNSNGTGTLNYLWDFGDGATSTLFSPTHNYTSSGSFTVTLIVSNNTGCRDTLTKINAISIGTVQANFSSSLSCLNKPVTFTNTSTPAASASTWYFLNDGTSATGNTVTKIYSAANSYQVKLVSDFGACKDSITKTIIVSDNPKALFSNNPLGSCLPPLNVNFANNSTGATSYQWSFGDGGISSQPTPSHNYLQSGTFSVTLIATNANGCADTLRKDSAVIIAPPDIVAISQGAPYKGCAPYTSTFGATINTMDPIATYIWDFGDGSAVVNGSNPVHTYSSVGFYTIKLIVISNNGCTDTLVVPSAVELYSKPTANFSATPRNACAQDKIFFTDLSTGTITNYFWEFGDGGTSTSQNPVYNYTDTGFFKVKLTVENNKCKDSISFNKYIYINPPIALFSKVFSCDTPLQRRFIDMSKGATTYNWDFGDGTTSSLSNPVHTYPSVGRYGVVLEVTNGVCVHKAYDSVLIAAVNPSFSISPNSSCKHSDVEFKVTNADTSLIENYHWFFGDGSDAVGSSLAIIKHKYVASGNYSPSLTITDTLGCTYNIAIASPISIFGPTAFFTNTPGTCVNGTIDFTNSSQSDGINPIQKLIWFYGDGKIDTLLTPPYKHKYTTAGTFDVKLKVFDTLGCYDTLLVPNAVLITKPIAKFSSPDTIICKNANANFVDSSSGVSLNYKWKFGDGDSSVVQNAIHAYAAEGQYSVQLTLSDIFGCTDTLNKPLYIRVANSVAKFSFITGDSIGLCYPFLIKVASKSLNTKDILWSFGDGGTSNLDSPSHFYNYVGQYNLTLRAYGFGGCVDSVTTHMVIRGPTGSFTYTPLKFCKPATVNFTANTLNNASFVWDFNDGTVNTTSDSTVSHVFASGGSFKPKMILIDAAGCQVPITGADTIKVIDVTTKIKIPQTQFCDSVRLSFSDSSTVINDNIASYSWNFGDGGTSSSINPIHFYSQIGNYKASVLVTTQFGCKATDTFNIPISIIKTPKIKITGDSVGCENRLLQFNGVVIASDTNAISWKWNFANNNTSTLQIPSKQYYSTAGNYIISLVANNIGNCKDSITKTIVINPTPNVNAGLDSNICRGQTITLTPSGALTYVWNNDATLSCFTCTNPLAKPDSLKLYTVTGTNSFGCSNTDSVYVNVIQKFPMTVSNNDTICVGEKTQLLANGANNYTWLPATGLDNANIRNPIANPTTTTTYIVLGKDERSCFTDTGYTTVYVYQYPQFNIGATNITASVGSQLPISTTSSSDVIKWKWLPANYLSCYNCATPTATITENIKYTAEASNIAGCTTKDEITIETICSGNNIFIPNTFSPNGDGVNEIFYPRGKGLFGIRNWKIFNRWGEIVFSKNTASANNANDGWDGTYAGKKLGPDVYVYIMEVICDNNTIIPVKGNVAIIK